MTSSYVPLWVKSNFSFLEGASHPDEYVEEAQNLGLRAVALTDRDGVPGVVRAWERARTLGMKLLTGSELTLMDGSSIVLMAMDRPGYANLCRLVTAGRLRSPKGQCRVHWNEVVAHAPGLIALWGGGQSLLSRAEPLADAVTGPLREAFGDRLYALLARHRTPQESASEPLVVSRARALGLQTVAGVEVLYHTPTRRPLQDVLTCIRHGVSLRTAGTRTRPNHLHALPTPEAMHERFSDQLGALERTVEVAARCTFDLSEIRYRYPSERLRGRGAALLGARAARGARPARSRARPHRAPRLRRVLPDDVGDRPVLPRARHPVSGPRLGGELGGLLLPGHHGDRSGAHGPALRTFSVLGACGAARHRPRHHARAPRGGDPARLLEVRTHARGDGRERDPLPVPLRGPRCRQGPRAAGDDARPDRARSGLSRVLRRGPRDGGGPRGDLAHASAPGQIGE